MERIRNVEHEEAGLVKRIKIITHVPHGVSLRSGILSVNKLKHSREPAQTNDVIAKNGFFKKEAGHIMFLSESQIPKPPFCETFSEKLKPN